jgi:hypothetical protein
MILNGRQLCTPVTYEKIVALAGGEGFAEDSGRVTVTFHHAPQAKSEGSLTKGETVLVNDRTTIEVVGIMKEYFLAGPGSTASAIPPVRKAVRRTSELGVAGDYYEFGVFRGSTLYNAYDEATSIGNASMHFWGFDSFQGLPEIEGIDSNPLLGSKKDSPPIFHPGDYQCTLENVVYHLTDCGVDWNRIDLVPGWFEESLKPTGSPPTPCPSVWHKMERAAVVLVDCDLYVSAVPVLEFISPLLQTGTILIFDEYWNLGEDAGEMLAHREFSERHPEIVSKPLSKFEISTDPSGVVSFGPRAFTIERK